MRFRDTLEIGDGDIRVTRIDVSNPEGSCSHTYKASGGIRDCNIAYVFIPQCLCRAPRCTTGRCRWERRHSHRRRTKLGSHSAAARLSCSVERVSPAPLSRKRTALTTTSHPKIQPTGHVTYLSDNQLSNKIFPVYEQKLRVSVPTWTGRNSIHIPHTEKKKTNLKTVEKGSGKAESTKRHYPYFLLKLGS